MLENNEIINNYQRQKIILCVYQNQTKYLQVIKIENITNFYWEKVVFPWQRILFNTVEQAKLTIYSSNNATTILSDTIACLRLQISNRQVIQ